MKKFMSMGVAVLALAACQESVTGPAAPDLLFDVGGIVAYDAAAMSSPGHFLSGLHRLPEELRLSPQQAEAIRAALGQFQQATKADREAMAAIHKEARAAKQAGQSREEIAKILEKGAAIRARIDEAEAALKAKIDAILTPDQKAWLEANLPRRCDPRTAPTLSDEQKTEIRSLLAAYEEANRADLAAVKAALDEARAARANGASREAVKAILDTVRPAMERLAVAQAQLRQAIDALLTPEQRASGCFRGHIMPKRIRG